MGSLKFLKTPRPLNYLYFRSGLYGEQLERYLEFYDKENFLFLFLDFISATRLKEYNPNPDKPELNIDD